MSETTRYKVMVYVKEFDHRTREVYCGNDKEIALAFVQGYTRNGNYVHLIVEE